MWMAVSMRPHLGQGRSPFGISHEIKWGNQKLKKKKEKKEEENKHR